MKFFWKIFFSFTALIVFVFSIFGIWMIGQSFQNTLDKEIEEGNRENRVLQYAFEMNMGSISENYRTEKIVGALAKSVVENLDNHDYSYKLYRDSRHLLYESSEEIIEHDLIEKMADADCIYKILQKGNSRYLVFVGKSKIGGRYYYLESTKDITAVYKERDRFFNQYRVIMLVLILVTGIVVYLVSKFLTRSIVGLSYTTRRFANGDYGIRAKVSGEDEVGTLAQDFNVMADTLTQKMTELEEHAKKQEDFTASFAHELKTPLTSIIGYADMLRTMEMDKNETIEAANYIYSQGKRLESLSLKLLELIVMGKQDYQFRPLEVQPIVLSIAQMAEESLKKKEITLELDLEEGIIMGEKDLFTSLLLNLIDNARKALPVKGKICIQGRKEESGYLVAIEDNGCGMPQSAISRITEAFYMVDKSRSRKEGGAGLGMTLCNRIVEVHKASWKIESKEGEGTKIKILFPGEEVLHEK